MVIENKDRLHNVYCWLSNAYREKWAFKEFCVFMSGVKRCGIAYDELCAALRRSEKLAEEDIEFIELSILTKNNKCYKYRISIDTYNNQCHLV